MVLPGLQTMMGTDEAGMNESITPRINRLLIRVRSANTFVVETGTLDRIPGHNTTKEAQVENENALVVCTFYYSPFT
jgi:hypothetical protein